MQIFLMLVLLAVLYIFHRRRQTAKEREIERKKREKEEEERIKRENTPERLALTAAWKAVKEKQGAEQREAFLAAADADLKQTSWTFRIAVYFDTALYGFPFDPEQARIWYAKVKKYIDSLEKTDENRSFRADMSRFFEAYDHPAGNFNSPVNPLCRQCHRVQTALMESSAACIWFAEAAELMRLMKYTSPVAVQAMAMGVRVHNHEFDSMEAPQVDSIIMECINECSRLVPDTDKTNARPGDDYEKFAYALSIYGLDSDYNCRGTVYRMLAQNGTKRELVYTLFCAEATMIGSMEGFYEVLKNRKIFQTRNNWNDDLMQHWIDERVFRIVGTYGWEDKDVQRIMREFFPNAKKTDWGVA